MASDKRNQLSLKVKSHTTPYGTPDSFSPMTDLVYNLGSLSTVSNNDFITTPKRRISWSNIVDTPSPELKRDSEINDSSTDISESRSLLDISNEPKHLFIKPRPPLKEQFTALLQKSELLRNSPVKENLLCPLDWDFESTQDAKSHLEDSASKTMGYLVGKPLSTPNSIMKECDESKTDEPFKAKSCIRGLFRETSEPEKRVANKRPESCRNLVDTPLQNEPKRRKSVSVCTIKKRSLSTDTAISQKFNRCYSESEAMNIMKAVQLSSENPDLIGDFSRPYALPLTMSKHQDLKSISPETMASLIRGYFTSEVKNHIVIDCRFPYEYEGGHIQGALNIYTKEELHNEFITQLKTDSKSIVLIFHCEFSSERGPAMSRYLRNKDRETNEYPNLHYPEIYLLNGGYKAFYESCKELCCPQSYKPMLHEDHEQDLKYFRAKSKSMNPDQKKTKLPFRGLKF